MSRIFAFSLDTEQLVDWVDTELPPGSLMGITFDADGNLWFVDAVDARVVRISVPSE